jgi:hypothetical protein
MHRKERERLTTRAGIKQEDLTLVPAGALVGCAIARAIASGGGIRTLATPGCYIGYAASASAWRKPLALPVPVLARYA